MSRPVKGAGAASTANVTLTTTTETIIITSDVITPPYDGSDVTIWAWAQLTTGAGTTTVTPRIRRGPAITDPLVGEANAVTIGAAAGSTEVFMIMAVDALIGSGGWQYSLTLQQAAATGDGTALQAAILTLGI